MKRRNQGSGVILLERVERGILLIRGQRVIMDADLAKLYGVSVKALNQAVKRNSDKFPDDFIFRLAKKEAQEWGRLRSHFVTLKRGQHIKYLPYAFTEHGAIMAAMVLNSPQAVRMSVFVVRAFVRLRALLFSHEALARKLEELEARYDAQFKAVFDAIRELMEPPVEEAKRITGFEKTK